MTLESIARAATPGPWRANERAIDFGADNMLAVVNLAMPVREAHATAAHIAAWSPERALAALAVIAAAKMSRKRDFATDKALAAWDAL